MNDADRIREQLQISCADCLELMTDYLEEALAPADVERMRAHLTDCEACTVFLDQLRATIRIAGGGEPDAEFPVAQDRLEGLVEVFRREHHT